MWGLKWNNCYPAFHAQKWTMYPPSYRKSRDDVGQLVAPSNQHHPVCKTTSKIILERPNTKTSTITPLRGTRPRFSCGNFFLIKMVCLRNPAPVRHDHKSTIQSPKKGGKNTFTTLNSFHLRGTRYKLINFVTGDDNGWVYEVMYVGVDEMKYFEVIVILSSWVVVVVFTLNRSFYPTTSAVPPVSFLILHPREIQIMWSQTLRDRKTKRSRLKVGK